MKLTNQGFKLSIIFLTIFISFMVAFGISSTLPSKALLIAFALGILIISFVSNEIALYILILSMLLSPEITIGGQGTETAAETGRAVILRLEDLLLVIMGFSWFAKTAINKELALLLKTPLNRPIFYYIFVCSLSTLFGIYWERVEVKTGFFYVLKYIEYFFIYFMVVNNVERRNQLRNLTIIILFTCLIVCIVGIAQIPSGKRVSAPFEGEVGEPNTFGGYLALILSIVIGLFLYSQSPKLKISFAAFGIIIIIPFLYSLSRASWIALVPMVITLLIFSPKRIFIVGCLITGLVLSPYFLPKSVEERIAYTFKEEKGNPSVKIGKIGLDPSTSSRIISWQNVLKDYAKHPIFGYGITGYKFVDAQYFRVLAEVGIVGMLAFLWMIYSLMKEVVKIYYKVEEKLYKGLSLGFLVGIVAMLTHGIGANTFIIIRIMEPFWFLAGIVMVLPKIEESSLKFK